ncbi:hypothetical protein BKA61DRAFT_133030 [Leptodontidium sp. MPI-SDFR-AT-0119]|nr:hypothetical protein BKA61DRAFT_133030 [Leptodontidium sp. MPI-SDFR-AT-0119]
MGTHTAKDFWAALGGIFTVFFTPPCISLESLRHDNWRVHFTVRNVSFGFFWATAFFIATDNGVWSRLWEYLLVDVHTFCDCAPWTCDRIWWIIAAVVAIVVSGWGLNYIYAKRLNNLERIRKIVACTTSYLQSAYQIKTIAQLVDIIPVFIKQLSMNYFLYRTRDDDGEIMIIGTPEEKPESNKRPKLKFGVPRSIRIKQKQAIESAQAVVANKSNGSIRKASGSMKER